VYRDRQNMRALGCAAPLFAHARCSNRPINDPTCSFTNPSTFFLYRALIETALWQESTPISQNRDWFEWMARETLDLEPCSKSQTTRSVAARLGHDRQPGTLMHVFLCCHSKTAISLYSRTLRNRLRLLSSFHSHIFTSADNRF
jgi:hypothetical protein